MSMVWNPQSMNIITAHEPAAVIISRFWYIQRTGPLVCTDLAEQTSDAICGNQTIQTETQPVAAVIAILTPVKPKNLRDQYCLRCSSLYIHPGLFNTYSESLNVMTGENERPCSDRNGRMTHHGNSSGKPQSHANSHMLYVASQVVLTNTIAYVLCYM
ncbi:hypothetical protein DPMN_002703 [Dreissena polymorpha]|uniref:Uncharacterized protein n=1 Tax=Dreissena polymorpha TaxID=45954 RepID=A0A9D4RU57_DREPO|nr:hypothetical protein DPMN_002703 [Dreissena polymorpha]